MQALIWFGVLFVILLVACICLYSVPKQPEATPRRCPRTMAAAHHSQVIGYGGKCYEVFTCSEACAKNIEKLVDASADAFTEKYGVEQSSVQGKPGLHLRHHISKERVQFALEVAC